MALGVGGGGHSRRKLLHTLFTGTPAATTLLSENFNAVAPGMLPVGWTAAHGGGINTVRWATSNTFCSNTSNAAFHTNAADGPPTGPFTNARWDMATAFGAPVEPDV